MRFFIYTLTITLFFFGCKKIVLPNNQSEQLIGRWKYLKSNGGVVGKENNSQIKEIEFTKYGKYKYNDEKLINHTKKFEIVLNRSIYTNEEVYQIKYESHNVYNYQSFKISNDTLYLSDEAFDGFGYIFIRK